MTSKTDIINLALAHLGQDAISSQEQNSAPARVAGLLYDALREEVLRTHDWSFAARVTPMARVEEPSPYAPLPVVYAEPADCLYLRNVTQEDGCARNEPYKRFVSAGGRRLVACAITGAVAHYTRDEKDVSLFDPAFTASFVLALATEMAMPITGDSSLAQLMLQKYTLKLDEARRTNKNEQFEKPGQTSEFVSARS